MADLSESSESLTSGSNTSDFEGVLEDKTYENELQPFCGIQQWRFEPPGRTSETQETEENIECPCCSSDMDSKEW